MRLGQKEFWPWETLEDAHDDRLKPLGYTLKTSPRVIKKTAEFKKYERQGFATLTGKVELYSTVLEKLGYDPLPYFKEAPETQLGNPELAKEYPFTLLTGGRVYNYYHSEWRQVKSVRKKASLFNCTDKS
ncbi:MAG: hypothetical protein AB1796_04695 [Bacillota bacterium]